MAQQFATPQYKRNIIQKGNKASRTPGKAKGDNCQTNKVKKFFMSSPKAYKHRDYPRWHELCKRMNSGARV